MDKKKQGLKMRRVEDVHLGQYIKLQNYVFQVTHSDLSEIGWEEDEMREKQKESLKQADLWGWFDQEQLISQVAVYPMEVRIFNKTFAMGGLTNVGTFPEYSNLGLMNKLIVNALEKMKENNQSISYLFPYSIPYYRRKGWEIISDKIMFEVKDSQLPKIKQVSGRMKRVEVESDEVKTAYEKFALQTHGALLRNEFVWSQYWLWDSDDLVAAVYYNTDGEPEGYVLYWIAEEVFHIKDMIFLNEEARSGIWNFISAHFSMIRKVEGNIHTDEPLAFLLEDADIKETISPYYMARIVDIKEFIKQYPFKPATQEREWTFNLNDPLLSWNQGTFTLRISMDGKGEIVEAPQSTEASIDIQTLTTMLLGYKRPDYLLRIGRLSCSPESVDMLEDAIEQKTPYFSDFF